MNTDPFAALSAADPARDVALSPDEARHLVRAAIERPRRRRRRWVVPTAAIIAVFAIGVPGVAAASGYLARTGWFGSPNPGSPEGTQPVGTEADGSEWIEIDAPDYVEVAVGLWPAQAILPPGSDTMRFATSIAERTATQGEGLRQVTGIRSEFEQYARCAWRAEWLDADALGDTARAQTAAQTLTTAATWPATVATDGGGIVDEEKLVARAATAGDRAGVEAADAWCGEMLAGLSW
ncbi:hypothetical protein [Microbacterium sp. Kw_RZR3]|jgi:hypothetical protein|uniref:hypothetical protein n=1 Tax=unclassified Microbacterium TaxID=2609290 RepID=UPI0023DB709A|nr:hypothetical protein [Microbacterium sp. Kw_RZR3]MDF2046145.1 hypothetical protein [Microbacterium sp. Kw_RZR3]